MVDSDNICLDLNAIFGNSHPVEVDIGCGKGRFLIGEARSRPHINFLGVDRTPRKLERAHQRMIKLDLPNVRLFRCDIYHFVEQLLPKGSVSVFHVYFPDPWPKKKHRRRRFFTSLLLKSLNDALDANGSIWVATDSEDYFVDIREIFEVDIRFQRLIEDRPPVKSQTDFEQNFNELELPIYRIGFTKKQPAE